MSSVFDMISQGAAALDKGWANVTVQNYAKSHGISNDRAQNILISLGMTMALQIEQDQARKAAIKAEIEKTKNTMLRAAKIAGQVTEALQFYSNLFSGNTLGAVQIAASSKP